MMGWRLQKLTVFLAEDSDVGVSIYVTHLGVVISVAMYSYGFLNEFLK